MKQNQTSLHGTEWGERRNGGGEIAAISKANVREEKNTAKKENIMANKNQMKCLCERGSLCARTALTIERKGLAFFARSLPLQLHAATAKE